MHLESPLDPLAASLHHALLSALPPVEYLDRDWKAYNRWKATLPPAQLSAAMREEQRTGKSAAPENCGVSRQRRPQATEVSVRMFPQMWSSTALGFDGVAGQAMTLAYTVVVSASYDLISAVYFGGRFAYLARNDGRFHECLANEQMPAVRDADNELCVITDVADC